MKRLALILVILSTCWSPATESGLELKLELLDAKRPEFRVSLLNRGKTAIKVAKPGIPQVRLIWSGQTLVGGHWQALVSKPVPACGIDAKPTSVILSPGQSLDLGAGFRYPSNLEVPPSGQCRISVRYEFNGSLTLDSKPVAFTR